MVLDEAQVERILAAERHVAYIRLLIVVLNSYVYLALMPAAGTIPQLAYAIIVVANTYSLVVILLEPQRRFPALLSSTFTTLTDGALITLWLLATGGIESPFYVLWYISLAAVAYRFDATALASAGLIYSALYLGIAAWSDALSSHTADLVVRIGYIGFFAGLGALISRESHAQFAAKVEMRERMKEARTAEAKFRGLLEAAPDPIVLVDAQGRIVLANTRALTEFGYTRDDLLGVSIDLLIPGVAERVKAAATAAASSEMRPHEGEFAAVRRDAHSFPVEVSLSPITTDEGAVVMGIIHDVTDRKHAEEERLTSLARLKELERLRELDGFKTQFINTAAHELGTPLTPIKLQLHMLKTAGDAPFNERQTRALAVLDRNVERLHVLVQDVLKVARLQAGRLGVVKAPIDLNRVVYEVAESFQDPALEAGLTIELRTTPGLMVEADGKRIAQVVNNLLNNAWKFTPRGGRITVETKRTEEGALVSVRDTGAGMRAQDIERLFQPFSQVHDTMQKTHSGTGLGLYICKGILDLHAGRIWAESPGPGLGATFSFLIPFESEPAPSPAVVERRPTSAEGAESTSAIARRARELI